MSHVDPPVMEPVENVEEIETASDVRPNVDKRASRDYGRRGRVGAGA